jgi:hypothetical protein
MALFDHPFAILTAVFFFQVGSEIASQPRDTRRRYAAAVMLALVGPTLAGVSLDAAAELLALMYACIGGFALGFVLNVLLYRRT